jgi:recombinational DNA repair protein (RecF pathway)
MYITSAVTLSKKNIGEFDREYCFFTKKFGKIIIIAKGIRKANAKLQGQIEPPCLVDIDFNLGNQKRLTGALVKNNYPKIRENLKSLSVIHNILSLLNEYIIFSETDIEL